VEKTLSTQKLSAFFSSSSDNPHQPLSGDEVMKPSEKASRSSAAPILAGPGSATEEESKVEAVKEVVEIKVAVAAAAAEEMKPAPTFRVPKFFIPKPQPRSLADDGPTIEDLKKMVLCCMNGSPQLLITNYIALWHQKNGRSYSDVLQRVSASLLQYTSQIVYDLQVTDAENEIALTNLFAKYNPTMCFENGAAGSQHNYCHIFVKSKIELISLSKKAKHYLSLLQLESNEDIKNIAIEILDLFPYNFMDLSLKSTVKANNFKELSQKISEEIAKTQAASVKQFQF
jgi:hypothetical protein